MKLGLRSRCACYLPSILFGQGIKRSLSSEIQNLNLNLYATGNLGPNEKASMYVSYRAAKGMKRGLVNFWYMLALENAHIFCFAKGPLSRPEFMQTGRQILRNKCG